MAALPSHPCHARVSIPTLKLPTDGNTGLETLAEVEDGGVQGQCWTLAQQRLPPGAPDRHRNLSESKCLLGSIDCGRGLCVPHAGLTGTINTRFSLQPSPC